MSRTTSGAKVERLFKREPSQPQPTSKPSLFARAILKPRQPALSPEEAFLAILMGAARADGSVAPEEAQEIAALTGRTITLSGLSASKISEIQRRVEGKFEAEGIDKVLTNACHAVLHEKDSKPDEVRLKAESVLAHAIDLVFADRELHEAEQEYIEQLAEQLEISPGRVRDIASVIEIKNSY